MIRRLVEADYFSQREYPESGQITFWLRELRTPQLLVELASSHSAICQALEKARPLLKFAADGNESSLTEALSQEESNEREADRVYWKPLKAELEELRRERLKEHP